MIMCIRNYIFLFNFTAIYVNEDDIATYTIKAIDDPRTLNKTLYLRPPKNILSQREVVQIWEKLIGKELKKSTLSKEDFLAPMEGKNHIFYVANHIFVALQKKQCELHRDFPGD